MLRNLTLNEWTDYELIESTTAREPGAEAPADAENTRASSGFLSTSPAPAPSCGVE